jgi:hypothetical protein
LKARPGARSGKIPALPAKDSICTGSSLPGPDLELFGVTIEIGLPTDPRRGHVFSFLYGDQELLRPDPGTQAGGRGALNLKPGGHDCRLILSQFNMN